MVDQEKVKLHGMWASPFVRRVEVALKAKNIPYEYVEENLKNKTDMLLHYNPVYKKVPVLVHHDGRSVAESLVIIEYIDDTWKNHPPRLLPQDPYRRARVRFWADFINQQIFEKLREILKSHGKSEERAMKEIQENLLLVENYMEEIFEGRSPTSGQDLGLLEILLGTLPNIIKGTEEAIGVQVVYPDKHPLLLSWMTALSEHPLIKVTVPPHENLVKFLQRLRQKFRPHPKQIIP